MAHKRTRISILENSSGEGLPFRGKAPGAAAGSEVAAPSLVAKDSSNNLQYIPIGADGKIPVNTGAAGVPKSKADTETFVALNSDTEIVSIPLTASKTYNLSMALACCSMPALFRLEQVNDATTTIHGYVMTGPGQYSADIDVSNISFTTGATGTQELNLVAQQLEGDFTDAYGTVSALELP